MFTYPTDQAPKKPKDTEAEQKAHADALKRFSEIVGSELDQDNRYQANEDVKFVNEPGGMWDDYTESNWKGRPKFEVNQLQPMINVVIGDQKQSDFTSKVIPLGDGATKKTADVMNGIIRSINTLSNFDDIRDNAFREVCICGFGGWYITTEWCVDDPWSQDIKIYPIRSAINSVYWDPGSVKECNEDANFCFVCEWLTKEDFKEKYGDADMLDMPVNDQGTHTKDWYSEGKVRVADYWYKKPVKKTIGLFRRVSIDEMTGEQSAEEKTFEFERKELDSLLSQGWELVKQREMQTHKICFRKVSGGKFLTPETEWAGSMIPVVTPYGYQTWLDGARRFWGMVRFAKDSQRIYNYAWSGIIHAIAKAPKDPIWMTRKQASNPKDRRALEEMAIRDDPVIFYTPDPESPGPPNRSGGPQVPAAMLSVLSEATQNIQRVTGKFASSQGDNPMDQSGRAVIALQKQGDLGTFSLNDNLSKAIRRHTEILIDLVPRIFDTERQIRITESDGSTKIIQTLSEDSDFSSVNTEIQDQATGEPILLVDLSQGRYDVQEDVGASYGSRRQEALAALTEISHNNPEFGMLVMDEILRLMDFDGTKEAINRVRKYMTQKGLREPTEDELREAQERVQKNPQLAEPSPAEKMQFELSKMNLESMALDLDRKELDNKKLELEIKLEQQKAPQTAAKIEETLARVEKIEADTQKTIKETREFSPQVG